MCGWRELEGLFLSHKANISPGITYWFVISRAKANAKQACYLCSLIIVVQKLEEALFSEVRRISSSIHFGPVNTYSVTHTLTHTSSLLRVFLCSDKTIKYLFPCLQHFTPPLQTKTWFCWAWWLVEPRHKKPFFYSFKQTNTLVQISASRVWGQIEAAVDHLQPQPDT